MTAPSKAAIREGCEVLASRDAALARAYSERGIPEWRSGVCEFASLARMIAYQQVSTKAGAAIWGRVEALCTPLDPETVLATHDDAFRGAGLSRPKVKYVKAIAEAVQTGALCFTTLPTIPRTDAVSALTAIKGIGPWSAEIFLMSATGDLDAFPPGDIGLIESYRLLAGDDTRHDIKAFTALANAWAPYRGVATHLLWAWFNHHRGHESAPPSRKS
ncbi:MAG: DNA-3-methyladenine glycosylase 2 family protein [Pseudomonadota bacterium]